MCMPQTRLAGDGDVADVFTAMIDAALKESNK